MSDWWWDNPPRGEWAGPTVPWRCVLPGSVDPRPGHAPSAVTFTAPTFVHIDGMFPGRRRRWVQHTRVECECGHVTGRTRTVDRPSRDDIAARQMHTSHALRQPKTVDQAWKDAA